MATKDKTQEIEDKVADDTQQATNQEEETLSELEQAQADLQEEKDKFLRLFAEFENYKRRTTKERIELFKTAGQSGFNQVKPAKKKVVEEEKKAPNLPYTQILKMVQVIE